MSLLDVDLDAPRRIEGITAAGLRALGEVRQRAEDLDKAADEMFERQERARHELDEQVTRAAAQNGKPEEKPGEERPKPKRTLALGAEEFQQAREAKQPEAPKPVPPPPPAPQGEPAAPNRTLKLGAQAEEPPRSGQTHKFGARDDDEQQPEERPARRPRRPRPEGEDDMSGRTWLR